MVDVRESNKMKNMKVNPDGEAKGVVRDTNPLNLGILRLITYLHWGRELMSQTTIAGVRSQQSCKSLF